MNQKPITAQDKVTLDMYMAYIHPDENLFSDTEIMESILRIQQIVGDRLEVDTMTNAELYAALDILVAA